VVYNYPVVSRIECPFVESSRESLVCANIRRQRSSSLQRKLAHGESPLPGALLGRLNRQLVLGERAAKGARLLGSEIFRLESLVLVELAQVLLLRLIDDGEHARDCLAHVSNFGQLGSGTPSNLSDPQL